VIMADDDPRSRFSGIKEEYDSGNDGVNRPASQDGNDSNDGLNGVADHDATERNEVTSGNDGTESTDGKTSKEGLKARRKSVQAYVPPTEKESLEDTWRQVKALCNLANTDEPAKNDFYTAALREGYTNFEAMMGHLDLSEPYEEYGDILRA
jgi:hypothetical protein